MNDNTPSENNLEPVDIGKLFEEFGDNSVAELMLTIKELRSALDQEKKAHSFDERQLRLAEEELELLKGRINTSITVLSGESDICIDCEAVKKPEDTE